MSDGGVPEQKTLLHIDDDHPFAEILQRRLLRHGWQSHIYLNTAEALEYEGEVHAIVLDLNLNNEASLPDIPALKAKWSDARLVMLTGYASIATTVTAIKLGADDYLAKPVELNQLLHALLPVTTPTEYKLTEGLSPEHLEWELIQRTLQQHQGNISATARALKMHRRTLQRKLQKRPGGRVQ